MNELKIIGKERVGKYEFTGIEGGFGENKKAMLVKDIAAIHGKDIRYINKQINANAKRFKTGIDVIDFLSSSDELRAFAKKNDLIGSNRTEHVYLLSERGYSKLLKILEDDTAWDVYDQLVDNYFNMRQAIHQKKPLLVADKRLEIMGKNAATRKANLIYKIAMASDSDSSKQLLLADAAKELTGKMMIPILKHKEYSASDIGISLGITANKVGRICNNLGLKAEQPKQNKYGRWATNKAKYNPSERPTWVYFNDGFNAIKNAYNQLIK